MVVSSRLIGSATGLPNPFFYDDLIPTAFGTVKVGKTQINK